MRRCLMAKDLVRHPGSIGIKSPPDRSVSLPDPRDTAVSMMGFGDDWQPGDIPDATEGGYTPAPGYELPPHPWPPLQPLKSAVHHATPVLRIEICPESFSAISRRPL